MVWLKGRISLMNLLSKKGHENLYNSDYFIEIVSMLISIVIQQVVFIKCFWSGLRFNLRFSKLSYLVNVKRVYHFTGQRGSFVMSCWGFTSPRPPFCTPSFGVTWWKVDTLEPFLRSRHFTTNFRYGLKILTTFVI